MTGEGNGRPRKYRVSISGLVAIHIKELGRQADQSGRLVQFKEALLAIYRRLRADPLDFGELTRRLPDPEIVLHVGGVPPLTVRFAIHKGQRVAIVIKLFLHPA